MMSLPRPLAELAWNEIHDFEKEKSMPIISTAERVGLEKGLEKGRQEGLEMGLEKARDGLLSGIEVALDLKFAAPGLALLSEIQQLDDVELLGTILKAVKRAASPEALRQLWSPPPPTAN